jgi:hypothetical protein
VGSFWLHDGGGLHQGTAEGGEFAWLNPEQFPPSTPTGYNHSQMVGTNAGVCYGVMADDGRFFLASHQGSASSFGIFALEEFSAEGVSQGQFGGPVQTSNAVTPTGLQRIGNSLWVPLAGEWWDPGQPGHESHLVELDINTGELLSGIKVGPPWDGGFWSDRALVDPERPTERVIMADWGVIEVNPTTGDWFEWPTPPGEIALTATCWAPDGSGDIFGIGSGPGWGSALFRVKPDGSFVWWGFPESIPPWPDIAVFGSKLLITFASFYYENIVGAVAIFDPDAGHEPFHSGSTYEDAVELFPYWGSIDQGPPEEIQGYWYNTGSVIYVFDGERPHPLRLVQRDDAVENPGEALPQARIEEWSTTRQASIRTGPNTYW